MLFSCVTTLIVRVVDCTYKSCMTLHFFLPLPRQGLTSHPPSDQFIPYRIIIPVEYHIRLRIPNRIILVYNLPLLPFGSTLQNWISLFLTVLGLHQCLPKRIGLLPYGIRIVFIPYRIRLVIHYRILLFFARYNMVDCCDPERFILEIQSRPAPWDKSSPMYADTNVNNSSQMEVKKNCI